MSEIEHQPLQHRFILSQSGEQAVLEYSLAEPDIDFTHTFVPPALRGGGVALTLVKHGLQWAREQDYQIAASCWYVEKVLQRERRNSQA